MLSAYFYLLYCYNLAVLFKAGEEPLAYWKNSSIPDLLDGVAFVRSPIDRDFVISNLLNCVTIVRSWIDRDFVRKSNIIIKNLCRKYNIIMENLCIPESVRCSIAPAKF